MATSRTRCLRDGPSRSCRSHQTKWRGARVYPDDQLESVGASPLGPTTYAAPRSAFAIHSGSTIRGEIDAPLSWWRAHLPAGVARVVVRLWPWLLICYLGWVAASWLIAVSFASFADFLLRLSPAVTAATPVLLVLILVVAFAHDIQPQADSRSVEAGQPG
jgi:hypothetical protein